MITDTREYFRKAIKLTILTTAMLSLSGCIVAIAPAFQVASLALDGVSYVATGKSVTDHAISTVTAQDCAMTRMLKGESMCSALEVQTAMLPDGSTASDASDVASTIISAEHDEAFQVFAAAPVPGDGSDADEVLDHPEQMSDSLDMQTAGGPML